MASGYVPPRRTAQITGSEAFAGLTATVLISPLSLAFILEFRELMAKAQDDLAALGEAFQRFGDHVLLEWNVVDAQGNPVPATGEGVLSQPPELVLDLIVQWTEARQVPLRSDGQAEPGSIRELEAHLPGTSPAN
jgi:hypothetical protein